MPVYISPNSAEILMTAVYGTAATVIGIVTVYQGRRAWAILHHHSQGDQAADIELGRPVSQSTLPPFESVEGAIGESPHSIHEEHRGAVATRSESGGEIPVASSSEVASAPPPQQEALSIQLPLKAAANSANLSPTPRHEASSDDAILAKTQAHPVHATNKGSAM